MTTRLSVSWTAYQKSICNGFGLLQQRGEFVDMTLAADGHHVQVHKMVMSLISPYIKELITATQCAHPVIFLNNVSQATLQHILEYIYTGEVLIPPEHIKEFLHAGKSLHIRGLENMRTVHLHRETEESFKSNTNNEQLHIDTTEKQNSSDDTCNDETNEDTTAMDDNDVNQEMKMSQADIPSNTDIRPKKITASMQGLQYTITNQGNLQVILNRYMYTFHYHRLKADDFVWRCCESKKYCMATLITRNGKVVKRLKPHNHPFHDKQILKRLHKGLVYSELGDAQNVANIEKEKRDWCIREGQDIGNSEKKDWCISKGQDTGKSEKKDRCISKGQDIGNSEKDRCISEGQDIGKSEKKDWCISEAQNVADNKKKKTKKDDSNSSS